MQAPGVVPRAASVGKWEQNSDGIRHLGGTIKEDIRIRRQLRPRDGGRSEPPGPPPKQALLWTSQRPQVE